MIQAIVKNGPYARLHTDNGEKSVRINEGNFNILGYTGTTFSVSLDDPRDVEVYNEDGQCIERIRT